MTKDFTRWKHWQLFAIGPLLASITLYGVLVGLVIIYFDYAENYGYVEQDLVSSVSDGMERSEHYGYALVLMGLFIPFMALQSTLLYFHQSANRLCVVFPEHFTSAFANRFKVLRRSFTICLLLGLGFWIHYHLTFLDHVWPRNYDDIGAMVTLTLLGLLALFFIVLAVEFSVRLQRALKSAPYSWLLTTVLMVLYPIGVWILTPQLNRIHHPRQRDIVDELTDF